METKSNLRELQLRLEKLSNEVISTWTARRIEAHVKKFPCSLCKSSFTKPSRLRRHMITHTGERNHVCPICKKAYSADTTLRRHSKIHTEEEIVKKFHCTQCDKSFEYSAVLKTHMMHVHSDERPFKCSMDCGKTFKTKYGVETHIRTHTGEKPFNCVKCDFSTNQRSQLNDHDFRRHNKKRTKSFACEYCRKMFFTKTEVNAHRKICTQNVFKEQTFYECPFNPCGAKFTSKTGLQSHILCHTGEKAHKCGFCGKRYRELMTLKDHILTHTRELPFECEVCLKRFRQRSTFRTHLKRHSATKKAGKKM